MRLYEHVDGTVDAGDRLALLCPPFVRAPGVSGSNSFRLFGRVDGVTDEADRRQLLMPPFGRATTSSTVPPALGDYEYLLGIRELNFVPTGLGGKFIHNNFLAIANLFATIYPMVPKAVPTPPINPVLGQTYFNTTSRHFFGWNGFAWKQLD